MDSCPYCAAPTINSDQTCPNCGANLHGFQLETGATLGKYQIGRVLGQGGFGITYQARDTVLQREVAIKELFPDGSTRKNLSLIPPNSLGVQGFLEAKTRFLTEARTLAQFNHPGIVRVLEVFEANNTAYLVMEALTGETLGAKIAREKKLPEETVKKLALELCDALSVVHKVGLLHRDIKPDNIFLSFDARVVLIDFGSARSFRASERTQHTQLVTPGYAAPEQYASEAKFGEYTDVYGVAATLYHALTGTQPPSAGDMFAGIKLKPISSSVSEGLRSGIEQGLKAHIDERPQTASALRKVIEYVETRFSTKEVPKLEPEKVVDDSVEWVLYRSSSIILTNRNLTVVQEKSSYTKPLSEFKGAKNFDQFVDHSSITLIIPIIAAIIFYSMVESKIILTDFLNFLLILIIIIVLPWLFGLYIVYLYDKSKPIEFFTLNVFNKFENIQVITSRNRKDLEPILHELELIFNPHRRGSPNPP